MPLTRIVDNGDGPVEEFLTVPEEAQRVAEQARHAAAAPARAAAKLPANVIARRLRADPLWRAFIAMEASRRAIAPADLIAAIAAEAGP